MNISETIEKYYAKQVPELLPKIPILIFISIDTYANKYTN